MNRGLFIQILKICRFRSPCYILLVKVRLKVKSSPYNKPCRPRGGVELQPVYFFNFGARSGVGGQRHTPATLQPGKSPGTNRTGGWAGPRAGREGCRKFGPDRDSIP
jgi:hypothetical protein